jgi:hypothetical protein
MSTVLVSIVGVNDMMPALHQGWHYRLPAAVTEPDAEREEMSRAFALSPKLPDGPASSNAPPVPWYKTTALWQLAHRTKETLAKHRTIRMGLAGQSPIVDARRERLTAAKVDSLPSLDAPMIEYRRNLNAMADLADAARVQLVFVTQPSAWRDDLSEAEERQLWLGLVATDRPSGPVYFTTHALGRAMARYNATLLEVCQERRSNASMPRRSSRTTRRRCTTTSTSMSRAPGCSRARWSNTFVLIPPSVGLPRASRDEPGAHPRHLRVLSRQRRRAPRGRQDHCRRIGGAV